MYNIFPNFHLFFIRAASAENLHHRKKKYSRRFFWQHGFFILVSKAFCLFLPVRPVRKELDSFVLKYGNALHRAKLLTIRPCRRSKALIVYIVIVVHNTSRPGQQGIIIIVRVRRTQPKLKFQSNPYMIYENFSQLFCTTIICFLHTVCYHFLPILQAGFDNRIAFLLFAHTALVRCIAAPLPPATYRTAFLC